MAQDKPSPVIVPNRATVYKERKGDSKRVARQGTNQKTVSRLPGKNEGGDMGETENKLVTSEKIRDSRGEGREIPWIPGPV